LEDNSFKYLLPKKYERLDKLVKGSETKRKRYEEDMVNMLVMQMKEAGVGILSVSSKNGTLSVTGRAK